MVTTRSKKTIKINPLAVSESRPIKRTGLLASSSAESATQNSGASRPKPVPTAKPATRVPQPTVAVELKPVVTKKNNKKVKTDRATVAKVPAEQAPKKTSKSSVKVTVSDTSSIANGSNDPKAGDVAARRPPVEKQPKVKQPADLSPSATEDVHDGPPAAEKENQSTRADQGKTYFDWLYRKPSVRVRDGKVLGAHEIVRSPQLDVYGFYEADGNFVSLMHLEGPVDQPEANFLPLALTGFAIGGPLGLVAASLLKTRKHSIFLSRQPSGEHKYVLLDSKGIEYIKRVVHAPSP